MNRETNRAIRDLIDVATGQIPHLYMGRCPDVVDGHKKRDKKCPACRVIERAEKVITEEGEG